MIVRLIFLLISATLLSGLGAQMKVLALSGSSRSDSANKKLVIEAAFIATKMGVECNYIDLRDYPIPFYDGDLEKNGMPENAKKIRRLMIESELIMIASPEYNASVSALLKNTIDWSSRDENGQPSREALKGKKFLLMSASPGPGGGARGLVHLRAIIENCGGIVLSNQMILPYSYQAFNDEGRLKDQKERDQLQLLVQNALN